MLTAALIFAPLLGGYLLVTKWDRTRFKAAREDSQKLYFRAAFGGIFVFIIAGMITSLFTTWSPDILNWFGEHFSSMVPSSLIDGENQSALSVHDKGQTIVLLLSCLIVGYGLGPSLNWLAHYTNSALERFGLRERNSALKRVIDQQGDDIELLLLRALERTLMVMIDMANGKVYVGWVVEMSEPRDSRKTLRIMPVFSGYRDRGNMRVHFTTRYDDLYERIADCKESENGRFSTRLVEDFELVLPCNQLQSIKLFDPEAYAEFQQQKAELGIA